MTSSIFASRAGEVHPVTIRDLGKREGVELEEADGTVWWYPRPRDVLEDLAGPAKYQHWSLGSYLRRGRPSPPTPALTTLELFGRRSSDSSITVDRGGHVDAPLRARTIEGGITLGEGLPLPPGAVSGGLVADGGGTSLVPRDLSLVVHCEAPAAGIDLEARGHEVVKLLYAGFGGWIASSGFEADDVLQEVYKALLVRNRGRCPWDERKSSFGHYVHMVCRCVMSNLHRKAARRAEREQLGLYAWVGDQWKLADVSQSPRLSTEKTADPIEEQASMKEAQDDLSAFIFSKGTDRVSARAVALIPLRRAGMTRKEMAQVLGTTPAKVSVAFKLLKTRALQWSSSLV